MKLTKHQVNHWQEYLLENDRGMQVGILDYGGIITKIITPNKDGKQENIVLGYRNTEEYKENPNCFGAIVGRVAGRIKNASFTINDSTYTLEQNEGNNHLHSGINGFQHVIWDAEPFEKNDSIGICLTHKSPDGKGNYPGNIHVCVTYTLDNTNALSIDYHVTTDKTTPIAMTNHSYFNLSGDLKETIGGHVVEMPKTYVAELDKDLIPTGKWLDSSAVTFDFQDGKPLQAGLDSKHVQHQLVGGGYDHFFLFDEQNENQKVVVNEPTSGRTLTMTTTQPGVVMYSANGLDNGLELQGGKSKKHLGLCLETQAHPYGLQDNRFPSPLVNPGTPYHHTTTFQFSW